MNEIIPGQTISHYRITEKLGEGGMGIVYKAHDTTLDRNVALKFLPHYLTTDPNEKERFYHEARAAAALMHQNVAVIHEISDYEGQVFISMEYVEGETIKKIIENKSESLTVKKVLEIAIQVCEGLASAHEKKIVHRDIKSDNIMLTSKGQAKITDFGLAKVKGATKLTKEGSTVGTAAYMSPEQAQGEDVDSRSDIFSFGVVLYEMLTAHLPFPGEHQAALLYSLLNETPQPVARFNDKVSQELERIVFKALEKDKEERYQHIDDMLADLRKERKNLEYAKSGYVKASTINQISTEKTVSIKIKNLRIIIPAAIVVLVVAIFFIINPFNISVGEKQSSETIRKSLAVMYFEDIHDPLDKDHTGEMLTTLLTTSLSQVNGLDVISRERLLDIQKDLNQTDTKIISQSLASNIAKRAGVTTMLTGSIIQKSPKLAVTTRLIDVQSGKIISSLQLTSFSADQIFNLVDSLSYLLRNNFQIASTQPAEIKPVSDVTTKSTEAYRAYVEGLELLAKYYSEEARAAFERAIEIDSNFAMAYYYLSRSGVEEYWKYSQRAVELSDRVTEPERLQILAFNYLIQYKQDRVEELYLKLIKKYPLEKSGYYLAWIYFYNYNPEKAIAVAQAGLRINPSEKELWNCLAYSYAALNQKQQALNAINKYIALAPAEPNPYDTKGDIYVIFQDYDSSRIEYLKAIKLRSDFSANYLGFYAVLRKQYDEARKYFRMSDFKSPVIEIHRGQIKSALKKLLEHLNAQASAGERAITLFALMHLYYETGQFSEMLRAANNLCNESRKNPTDVISGRDYLAWALVKNGRSAEAQKLLGDMQKDVAVKATALQFCSDYSSGLVSFEEKKYDLTLQKFKKVFSKLPPNHEPNYFYAVTLLKCGKLAEAIKEFNRLLYSPRSNIHIPGFGDYWPIPAVKARYWLGVAYEEQGQKDKAIKEYEKFLDIWKDADFNSPEIKDAKMRVSKLKEVALK